ncbi:hypothetical protein [Thioalkalivibrio sp.]|uniref:hypothetical protein n=1 Tax=Thioalkalivibrio sp. TaxID=2093813 RepID=UPI003567513F
MIDLPSYFDGARDRGRGQYLARCPGPLHERGDRNCSLSLKLADNGAWLIHCFAGCDTADILGAVGLQFGDLFEDRPEPRRGRQPRWNPRDLLLVIRDEATICACTVGRLLQGHAVPDSELERTQLAVTRIQKALGVAGVR